MDRACCGIALPQSLVRLFNHCSAVRFIQKQFEMALLSQPAFTSSRDCHGRVKTR